MELCVPLFGLDKFPGQRYNNRVIGLVAQLGAHHIRIVGVEGSNPFKSTIQTGSVAKWFATLPVSYIMNNGKGPLQKNSGPLVYEFVTG